MCRIACALARRLSTVWLHMYWNLSAGLLIIPFTIKISERECNTSYSTDFQLTAIYTFGTVISYSIISHIDISGNSLLKRGNRMMSDTAA
jgi:hypothetical protein